MKFISTLLLGLMTSLLVIPTVLAADSLEGKFSKDDMQKLMCGGEFQGGVVFDYVEDNYDKAVKEGYEQFNEYFLLQYDGQPTSQRKCGVPNPISGFLEKGDCTAEGRVITELVEPIGPAISPDESPDDSDAYILNVYRGTCCFFAKQDGNNGQYECIDERDIYTLDFKDCTDSATLCRARQWLIGKSGGGILKVFVKQIYIFGSGLVGIMALMTLVISGIQISVSGVAGDITAAKQRIFQAIAGIVLLFMSGVILYTINPTFFS